MFDLRNDFLLKSKLDLENLEQKIRSIKLSDELFHEAFRKFHTIKGNAQTFGFGAAARIAHELEDLLAGGIADHSDSGALLLEGIRSLIESLDENPPEETERVDKQSQFAPEPSGSVTIFISNIPPVEFEKFASNEKDRLIRLSASKIIASLQTRFETKSFALKFPGFRDRLAGECEIIASLPLQTEDGHGLTAIRTYVAADQISHSAALLAKDSSGRFEIHTIAPGAENALNECFTQLANHATDIARRLGKDVTILVSTDEFDPLRDTTSRLFDIFLHLIRNSIGHSVDEKVNISIRLENDTDGINVSFSDDGIGLDLDLLRATALEKGLFSCESLVSEDEVKNMIFLPGLSTAGKLSIVSGRGYGLNAVQELVFDVNGTISVQSEGGIGTAFSIFLPNVR